MDHVKRWYNYNSIWEDSTPTRPEAMITITPSLLMTTRQGTCSCSQLTNKLTIRNASESSNGVCLTPSFFAVLVCCLKIIRWALFVPLVASPRAKITLLSKHVHIIIIMDGDEYVCICETLPLIHSSNCQKHTFMQTLVFQQCLLLAWPIRLLLKILLKANILPTSWMCKLV